MGDFSIFYCPFCNHHKAIIETKYIKLAQDVEDLFTFVECLHCHAKGPTVRVRGAMATAEELSAAAQSWNSRVEKVRVNSR